MGGGGWGGGGALPALPLPRVTSSPERPPSAPYTHPGRGPEGIACYERALALAPRHAEALYNLGVAYTEQGHVDRALFVCGRGGGEEGAGRRRGG